MGPDGEHEDEGALLEVRPALVPPRAILLASPSKSATHRGILVGALTPHTVVTNALLSEDTVASLRLAIALGARVTAEPTTEAGARMLERLGDGLDTFEAVEPEAHPSADSPDEAAAAPVPRRWRGLDLVRFIGPWPTRIPRPLLAARLDLHVERYTEAPRPRADEVDLQNSGTTLRLGAAIAALGDRPVTLTGDDSLRTRPMGPLLEALAMLGADTASEGEDGRPPVTVGGPLTGGTATMRGDVSSQFVSGILIAAQRAPAPVTLELTTPLRSKPYVALTQELLARFGGHVEARPAKDGARGPSFHVDGPVALDAVRYLVPGDFSSAAFPLVAAAVTGGEVCMAALEPDAVQGDRAVVETLEAAGCTATWEADPERPGGHLLTLEAPAGRLAAFEHGFADTPDLFPPLAVLAACADGTSRLHDAAHVRLKESDRVAGMARMLAACGVKVEESEDALVVHGDPDLQVPPCLIESHDDHRLLMAAVLLGMRGPGPVYADHPSAYHVSYPRFRGDMDLMGAETRIVDKEAVEADLATTPTGDGGEGA